MSNVQPIMRTSHPHAGSGAGAGTMTAPSWEMRLGVVQMLALWAIIAATMILVFVFGFHAGRNQGFNLALESQDSEVVRLPVVPSSSNQKSTEAGELVALNLSSPSTSDLAADTTGSVASKTAPVSESAKNAPAILLDSRSGSSPTPASNVVGFEAKPAGQGAIAPSNSSSLDQSASARSLSDIPASPTPAPTTAPVQTASAKVETPQKVLDAKATKLAKKPANEPTKPAATAKASGKVGTGWYVQVAASGKEAETSALVNRLRQKGFTPIVQSAQVRNVLYSRVLVGPYKQRNGASQAQEKIASSGATKGEPFLRYIDS